MRFYRFRTRPQIEVVSLRDRARVDIIRGRHVEQGLAFRNAVHAAIIHPDGSITDLGVSPNLTTNGGFDFISNALGGLLPTGGVGSPATAASATSITATGTPWTTNQLAGFRVYAPVTGLTTAPVYGNIGSNTTSVATIDQWWTAADGVGTTPASTNAFIIGAGGLSSARFIGLTTDAGAPAAGDTTLASEITTGGVARALGAYAHTVGTKTYTITKSFSVTSGFTAIHKAGLFTCSTSTAGGVMVWETVLSADATVANGDTLQVTWTITLS